MTRPAREDFVTEGAFWDAVREHDAAEVEWERRDRETTARVSGWNHVDIPAPEVPEHVTEAHRARAESAEAVDRARRQRVYERAGGVGDVDAGPAPDTIDALRAARQARYGDA
ncbi:hypothetical protein [Dietzia sp. WMMA184]|uniref:hypothetical protein n=1 Tax=Dietzia sp. WMMA184 TaxID=2039808 RepID=UPI000BDE62CA|nr:hypothetical protein [Dietzia sp. WMMA184]